VKTNLRDARSYLARRRRTRHMAAIDEAAAKIEQVKEIVDQSDKDLRAAYPADWRKVGEVFSEIMSILEG